MHDYLFPIEVVRFAFIMGVVVSMLLYERRHLTTGSIVVPGYMAVFLLLPSVILATMLNAALSYVLVNKVMMRWFLLYGRAKFTVLAIISISLQTVMLKVSPSGPWLWEADVPLFVGVGYVVPALIAHDMARQGIAKTAKSVLLASTIIGVPIVLAVVLRLPDVTTLAPFQPISQSHLASAWIPLAVLLSALAARAWLTTTDCDQVASLGAALVAVFAVNVWQVLFLVLVAIATNQLVTRVLMTRLILFGRRKFASMLMLSSGVVWLTVWTGQHLFPAAVQEHLGVASLALTPLFLPGLLANDMQRASILRVLAGVALASTFVLTATWTVQSIATQDPQSAIRTVVAMATAAVIFGPQLRRAPLLIAAAVDLIPSTVRPGWGPVMDDAQVVVAAPRMMASAAQPGPARDTRPLVHRAPLPATTHVTAWLKGRRYALAMIDRPQNHLAGTRAPNYRPRHLASASPHRRHLVADTPARAVWDSLATDRP